MGVLRVYLVILFMVFVDAAANAQETCEQSTPDDDLVRLVDYMTGAFSSADQARMNQEYFDIHLKMCRIWKDRTDGYWLYVEQAVVTALDAPYRVRVYHVRRRPEGDFESVVYAFDDPSPYVGAWKKPSRLDPVTPDDLVLREGCAVVLKTVGDDGFEGSTVDKNCQSDFRGAAYATSIIRISPTELVSWDRGFDADDQRVWGAEKGGYIFKKRENWPID